MREVRHLVDVLANHLESTLRSSPGVIVYLTFEIRPHKIRSLLHTTGESCCFCCFWHSPIRVMDEVSDFSKITWLFPSNKPISIWGKKPSRWRPTAAVNKQDVSIRCVEHQSVTNVHCLFAYVLGWCKTQYIHMYFWWKCWLSLLGYNLKNVEVFGKPGLSIYHQLMKITRLFDTDFERFFYIFPLCLI